MANEPLGILLSLSLETGPQMNDLWHLYISALNQALSQAFMTNGYPGEIIA